MMNGILSPGNTSRSYPTDWSLAWIEAFLLIGGGVMAVILHRSTDLSLGLPGHHGIEWMAIMILGRASSRYRGAGTLTSIGASFTSLIPGLQSGNSFAWLFYLLPGLVMDFSIYYFAGNANKIWFLALLGGLAHTTKPLGQLTVNLITGWPFGSFRYGVAYPFASHMLYGTIGGLLGVLILFGIHCISSRNEK